MLPLTPELAFQSAANHAAAQTRAKPEYVDYGVATHVTIPSMSRERDYASTIMTRTSDDLSVIQDDPHGARHVETHPFPFAPTFDALSDFSFTYGMNMHKVWFQVTSLTPRVYSTTSNVDADVTATGLRDYSVHYAPDSSKDPHGITHLLMRPFDWVRNRATGSVYFFHEVWIDNATQLPTRIDFDGSQHLGMSFVYGYAANQWVVTKAHLEQDMAAPFHLGKIHFLADATFSDITFPAQAPAPELHEGPPPAPVAAPPAADNRH